MRIFFVTKEAFFILLFGAVVIYVALNLQGCSYPLPKVDVTFWAGDSAIGGVSRNQDNEHMKCSEPKFEDYACLSYTDVKKIYSAMLQCQTWGPPTASNEEMNYQVKKNQEVINHVLSSPTPR